MRGKRALKRIHNRAVLHHPQRIGHITRDRQIVCDKQRRKPSLALKAAHKIQRLPAAHDIQPSGGFVENDATGLHAERPRNVAYMISGPFIGILFVNMNGMQSVGSAFPATVLSVLRQGVLLIPLLYLLQALFGLQGVIYGQSVTDLIAIVLSMGLWRGIFHKAFASRQEKL